MYDERIVEETVDWNTVELPNKDLFIVSFRT